MPALLKPYFFLELKKYVVCYNKKDFATAWNHLERAHVIGQKYPYQHSLVHYKMLLFGFKIKNIKEIFGQITRLLFGGVKSFVGKIPVGNTGGSNVHPLKPMPISVELQEIFKKAGL